MEVVIQVCEVLSSVVLCCSKQDCLNFHSFLVVQKTQMEGEITSFRKKFVRGCKSVGDSHTFESFQKSAVAFRLLNNLFSDRWRILTSISFSKDEKRSSRWYIQIPRIKASFHRVVQLVQCIIKIVSHI